MHMIRRILIGAALLPVAAVILNGQTTTRSTLDGVYTAFGRVVDGMAAVDAIEAAPRTGEAPDTRIELKTVRIEKRP